MPKKAEWEDPQYWHREIRRATDRRDHYATKFEWERMMQLWDYGVSDVAMLKESNEQKASSYSHAAFVNWPWAFAQTFIPAVYWRHPKINVRPARPMYMEGAKYVQPNINASLRLSRFRTHTLRALGDLLAFGHGWIKLGWFTRFGEVPAAPGAQGKGLSTIYQESYLKFDEPYAYRVPPHHITLDPDAANMDEARWVCQEYYALIDDVKKDPYLKGTDDVAAVVVDTERDTSILPVRVGDDYSHRDAKWVRMFEIWDRTNGAVYTWCYGSKAMNRIVKPWPYQGLNGFPFKQLAVTHSTKSPYPVSPLLPWLPLVEELNFLRTMRMEHMRKMVKKILGPPGSFTKEQLRAFTDPDVDFVECDYHDKLSDFEGLKPEPNMYASEDKVKEDIREISGFSEILSGNVPFSRIAATTSAIMEKNATIRFDHYSELIGDFIIECAQDLFKIVRDFQEYPQEVEVSGEPKPEWMQFTRKEIEGEYVFGLDLEEMSVSSKQQKIKEAYDALTVLSQFPEVRRESLIRDMLLAFGKVDMADYIHPPAGPPLDPQHENKMMFAGYPVEPNPNEDFQLHLAVHAQFIQQPAYTQRVAEVPAVGGLFSEHIQKTTRMAQASAQLGGNGRGAAPPAGQQSMQQGQANVSSTAPVAPGNRGQGGGAQALNRALSMSRGGG